MSDTKQARNQRQIGVLSLHNSKETKAILNAITSLGHEPVWLREENIQLITDNDDIRISPDVDVIINRLLLTKTDRPIEDFALLSAYDCVRPVLNTPEAVIRTIHKYVASTTLANNGIPVPKAVMALDQANYNGDISLTAPAVHKPGIGTNGSGMTRIDPSKPINPNIGGRRAFLQRFIGPNESERSDVRVYIVDGTIIGAMRRYAPPGEWRTNVAVGGDVQDVTDDLPSRAARLAIEATESLGLDYAGIDLIKNDQWYVLEVNATAGFKGLFSATNRNPAPYIAKLAIERVGGTVNESDLDSSTATLDDSVPNCALSTGSVEPSGTVGFTEHIAVGGGNGFETVIGKADTGAKRTSIDPELAASIGAGPISGTTKVKSGSVSSTQTRPLVEIDIGIKNIWTTVNASITDRSHMSHDILIGRDVLAKFQVDVRQRAEEE